MDVLWALRFLPLLSICTWRDLNRKFWEISPGTPPRLWLRYVNDTFIKINKRESDNFFKYINEVDPNIKFTQEECVDDNLAFLDCHVHLNPDGSLNSTVYRKPTHTDHYLQFDSHHPLIHKLGVIRTLHYRANTVISNPQDIAEEKDHIHQSLGNCGYPEWAFTKANKCKQPSQSPQSNKDDNTSVQARSSSDHSLHRGCFWKT